MSELGLEKTGFRREAGMRRHLFVKYFRGTIKDTVAALEKAGYPISKETAQSYFKDPAVRLAIRLKTDQETGVYSKLELQQMWTRIASGVETNRVVCSVPKVFEEEYIDSEGNKQISKKVKYVDELVDVPPTMMERLKASELLGKSVLAFVDKIEMNTQINLSIGDILDEDLRTMKRANVDDLEVNEYIGGKTGYDQETVEDAENLLWEISKEKPPTPLALKDKAEAFFEI